MKTKIIMSLDNNSKHIIIKYQLIHLASHLTEENVFVLFMHIVLILWCILDHKATKSVISDICKPQQVSHQDQDDQTYYLLIDSLVDGKLAQYLTVYFEEQCSNKLKSPYGSQAFCSLKHNQQFVV